MLAILAACSVSHAAHQMLPVWLMTCHSTSALVPMAGMLVHGVSSNLHGPQFMILWIDGWHQLQHSTCPGQLVSPVPAIMCS